jgi:hypothetical protein
MALTAVVLLAGCAAPPGGSPASVVPSAVPTSGPSVTATAELVPDRTPPIAEPKDVRAVPACELLTDDQLRAFALLPDTAEPTRRSAFTRGCVWSAEAAGDPVGVEVADALEQAALDALYVLGEDDAVFEEITVGGHPGLRSDFQDDGACTFYIAVAEYQAFSVEANAGRRDLPDPCDLPRRMVEAILSNLPPLAE